MEQVFKRDFSSLDSIFDFAGSFLAAEALSEEVSYAVNLAVEELFTNMVKYNTGGGGDITIRIDREGDDVVMQLVDSDVDPFDPGGIGDVDTSKPMEQRAIGGLGLHLVKSVVDKISYEYNNRRMMVTIVKSLEH